MEFTIDLAGAAVPAELHRRIRDVLPCPEWYGDNLDALYDLLTEQGQRLIYVFDPMFECYFFGSLKEMRAGSMDGVQCVESSGRAPKQLKGEDDLSVITSKGGKSDLDLDDDFYGGSQYDTDDIDMEGFQDVSFEDGSMF